MSVKKTKDLPVRRRPSWREALSLEGIRHLVKGGRLRGFHGQVRQQQPRDTSGRHNSVARDLKLKQVRKRCRQNYKCEAAAGQPVASSQNVGRQDRIRSRAADISTDERAEDERAQHRAQSRDQNKFTQQSVAK